MKPISRLMFWILTAGLVVTLLLSANPQPAQAQTAAAQPTVIYLFWGDGCPHCAAAKPFLANLAKSNPQVVIRDYEVWNHPENQKIFDDMAQRFGFEARAVPTIFIGGRYWEGYTETISKQIETEVSTCLASGCADAGDTIVPPVQAVQPHTIDLPLLGTVDLDAQSLVLSTLLISFVDGFNPCSLWVLGMLLALTLHTGSRKKIFAIGLVFLTVTAGIYGLFIAGLFTVLKIVSFVGWVRVAVALVALFFALVNIKDYFWYKEGLSFTIADDKKPGIFQKMRKVLDAGDSFWGLMGATVVLAAGVSLVEFSCTAGFPVLWTNLLSAQQVNGATFAALLLLYLLIYQLDELVIFSTAVITLRTSRLEEKHGRILKLIGGMLMLTLAAVMLIDPSLMNDLTSSLIIFGIAFAAAGLVLLVHRKLLPALGIWVGSEKR